MAETDSAIVLSCGPRYSDEWNLPFDVEIDGRITGQIAAGEKWEYPVDPGERLLRVSVNQIWSEALRIPLAPGESAAVVCDPLPRTWLNFFRALLTFPLPEYLGLGRFRQRPTGAAPVLQLKEP